MLYVVIVAVVSKRQYTDAISQIPSSPLHILLLLLLLFSFFNVLFVFQGGGLLALALGPLFLLISAILLCSAAVQDRIIKPVFERAIRNKRIARLLLQTDHQHQQ